MTLAPPAGAGGIDYVDLRAEGADFGVDDLAVSTAPQPDSSVRSGPPASTEVTAATFDFAANRPDVAGFRCSLDGAAFAACSPPLTLTGLDAGAHSFRVATVDAYGAVDATPAAYAWTVLGPAARHAGQARRDPGGHGRHRHDRLRLARDTPLRVQRRRRRLPGLHVAVHDARPRSRAAHAGRARGRRHGARGPDAAALRLRRARGRPRPARTGPTSIRTGSRTRRRRCRWATCRRWPACGRWCACSRARSTSSCRRPGAACGRPGRCRASCR